MIPFKMLAHENCNDMYSRLNVIVKDINALEVSKIDSGSINRKILMLLPKPKYNIINAMLQKENLDTTLSTARFSCSFESPIHPPSWSIDPYTTADRDGGRQALGQGRRH